MSGKMITVTCLPIDCLQCLGFIESFDIPCWFLLVTACSFGVSNTFRWQQKSKCVNRHQMDYDRYDPVI